MDDCYVSALAIIKKLVDHGFTAYFAGGWVRDFLMGHPSDDIDIVTNAPTEVICQLFPKTIPVGINFGIVIVVENGLQYEVAMFRKEEGFKDGRRPDSVTSGRPDEDAKRRDFTVNGMFYDPLKEELYDFVGGQEDLKKEVIRAIGNAHERFQEDRLRMIRAVRYAARFRFAIDPDTIIAILSHAKELFPAVAMERIVQEFVKMQKFDGLQEGIVTLYRLQLLQVIFPSLDNVSESEIASRVKNFPLFPKKAPISAFLMELFPRASKEEKLELCIYLKLSRQEMDFMELLEKMKFTDKQDLYAWAYILAHPQAEVAKEVLIASQSDMQENVHQLSKRLEKAVERIQNNTPVVKAYHLIEKGIAAGKSLGKLLKEAEKIAINEDLDIPEEVLKRLFSNEVDPLKQQSLS